MIHLSRSLLILSLQKDYALKLVRRIKMKNRYLTKSRFKLAMECPTKLFYTGKEEYVNKSFDDSFLKSLADGGFQVGELAKLYYSGGHDIVTLDYKEALEETNKLLQEENCIIYEAAIKYKNFFVRVDILVKEGNRIKLIEVKAKSTSETTDAQFLGKRVPIVSGWKPYIEDIAFQNYVAKNALPAYEIIPYLMLVNKNSIAPTDGLNQKFKIVKDQDGRSSVRISDQITDEDLSEKLLIPINVETACKVVYEQMYNYMNKQFKFDELIHEFAYHYKEDIRIDPIITNNYKDYEFKATVAEIKAGKKSGYHESFKDALGWKDIDFEDDTIFDLWDNRSIDKQLDQGKVKLLDLTTEDIRVKKNDKEPGLSRTERQWLQIEKSVKKDTNYWFDKEGLEKEMNQWTYPLHFIDFETSQPVIPFNKGRKPYEGIAFQFSHHIVYKDGVVEHKGEYLNVEPGVFPNYEFVRALKQELDNDDGTIFMYSNHENTYLNKIYKQLEAEQEEIEDRDELLSFIRSMTKYKNEEGPRMMVDMLELVKKYYYDPLMRGSNSIKVVLPAILNSSKFIREKYSKPVYGADNGIKSLNFTDWTWVKEEDGKILDPYTLLPRLFSDISKKDYDLLSFDSDELKDGGAAMTAYGRLQFENIPNEIRSSIADGLLKYCELDTLAMVIIYEAWKDMIKNEGGVS